MNILETILGAQNGAAVRQIGSTLGLPEDRTTAALGALVPALAAGLQRNAGSTDGLQSLLGAISSGDHAQYVDNPESLVQPAAIADGNGILGHVFGSKDVSRKIAGRAAAETGIDAGVLKKMLPMAAALTMGALARQSASQPAGAPAKTGQGLLGMLTATLDQNRSGSIVDEVLGAVGSFLRR